MTIYVSCQTHKFLKPCHVHIRIMSDSQIPKNVRHVPRKFNIFHMYNKNSAIVSCQTHKLKKKKNFFGMFNENFNIFVSCRIHKFLKLVCHDHIRVMSDPQIPKKYSSCTTIISIFSCHVDFI